MPDTTINVSNTNARATLNLTMEELDRIRDQVIADPMPTTYAVIPDKINVPNAWKVIADGFVDDLNEKIYVDGFREGYQDYFHSLKGRRDIHKKTMRKQPDRQVGIYKGHKIICSDRVGDCMCFFINDTFYINKYHIISHKVLEELLQFN